MKLSKTVILFAVCALVCVALQLSATSAHAQWGMTVFESDPVRPMALSPSGARLFVTNTPDNRLEIFDLSSGTPVHEASVSVGLEPVAVAARTEDEVWVVNHLSDSVSIVSLAGDVPEVRRTLLVGDEPRDIVFAGTPQRAFITTAHRGQNSPDQRGEYETPGVGRADVWVFDAADPGASLGGEHETIVTLFGDRPRPLAVSPDGETVYAGIFRSGNRTTVITEGAVCRGGPEAGPCTIRGVQVPGGVLGPRVNHQGVPAPDVGLIVEWDEEREAWVDEIGRDWSAAVPFDLPDYDVFEIAASAPVPEVTRQHSGVGTILFNMAVHPQSGALFVTNTEANNMTRFEGPGDFVRETEAKAEGEPATLRGHLHESRVTIIDGETVTPRHLNPHIDYSLAVPPAGTAERSIAQPMGMAFSEDGERLYIAGFGSARVLVASVDALVDGTWSPEASDFIEVGGGPLDVLLDSERGQFYTLTRFDNTLVTVDTASESVMSRVSLFNPEPAYVVEGRPFLYDARLSSSNGEASCGSCHIFGDMDDISWDLGNPDGDVAENSNPMGPLGQSEAFHPLKGPMATQSLRGMDFAGPLHWRGDRSGADTSEADPYDEVAGFTTFNEAFGGLLGREEGELPEEDMLRFAEFAMALTYPPNPIRNLDNSLEPDEERGRQIYFNDRVDLIATCNGCHTLNPSQGAYGTDGRTTFEGEPQEFKVAHLRNLYQRVGRFGMPAGRFFTQGTEHMGPQIRGYGFVHDGSVDTVERFFHASVFQNFRREGDRDAIEAFMMAFDSNLAPIVGQQVTLSAENIDDPEVSARAALLFERANTPFESPLGVVRECDLVAHGVVDGVARGYVYNEQVGRFQSDRARETRLYFPGLLALVDEGVATSLTLTCAPPGSGWRIGVDHDGDFRLDGDERAVGSDPEDASSYWVHTPIAWDMPGDPLEPGPSLADDVDYPDAGDTGAISPSDGSGGSGCSQQGGRGGRPSAAIIGFVLLAVRARRRVVPGPSPSGRA